MDQPSVDAAPWPVIIQGGMGVGVSGWRLARAVAERGHLGVVSGVGCETLLARRLQDGDPDGVLRDAMAAFPIPGVADAMVRRYFGPGLDRVLLASPTGAEGRAADEPYRPMPLYHHAMSIARQQQLMLGAFVEVSLAKRGHRGAVGINLLTKIQLPTLPTLYGAMLAGVDYVLMGAGIPREIPGVLDALAAHRPCTLRLDVEHAPEGRIYELAFDPAAHWPGEPPPLVRPRFLAIIASHALATMLARKATGRVDGFVVEGPTAGGHNAPPRGELRVDERGEPVYGPRDAVDLGALRQLGLPFWLAGGAGHPERLRAAPAAARSRSAPIRGCRRPATRSRSSPGPKTRRAAGRGSASATWATCAPRTRAPMAASAIDARASRSTRTWTRADAARTRTGAAACATS